MDPQTASIERKLRRVAQSFQARAERTGQSDVEHLFRQYDGGKKGSVLRSEFVNVLMHRPALLDVPGGSTSWPRTARRSDGGSRSRAAQGLGGGAHGAPANAETRMLGAGEGQDMETARARIWR